MTLQQYLLGLPQPGQFLLAGAAVAIDGGGDVGRLLSGKQKFFEDDEALIYAWLLLDDQI